MFDTGQINAIVNEARKHCAELPWVEFKTNNTDPRMIGESISALSNTAPLYGQTHALMIWGIEDITHAVVGTDFYRSRRNSATKGWIYGLVHNLTHRCSFIFMKRRLKRRRLCFWKLAVRTHRQLNFKALTISELIPIEKN